MVDADVPIPAASGDRRIEATPVNFSYFADLTGNIGSRGNPVPVSCLPTTHSESSATSTRQLDRERPKFQICPWFR
jgi:hypothetical protein